MDISQLPLSSGLSLSDAMPDANPSETKSTKIANAATQFEALLIGEMLKSVREASDDGWLGGGSDSSAESAYGVAESQLAQTIAAHGGFGLAKTIRRSLENGKNTTPTSNSKP